MPRLLAISPSVPFPAQDGVQLRITKTLRQLGGIHVDLLCLDQVGEITREDLPSPLAGSCYRIPSPPVVEGWRSSQLAQLVRKHPTLIWKSRSLQMREMVRRMAGEVDGVLAFGLQMAQYIHEVPEGVPTAVDNYNVESLILSRLAATRSGLKKLFWSQIMLMNLSELPN